LLKAVRLALARRSGDGSQSKTASPVDVAPVPLIPLPLGRIPDPD